MQLSDSSYDFPQPVDLEGLTKFRSEMGPVFSLYLDLGSQKRSAHSVLERFDRLLEGAREQKKLDRETPEYRQSWDNEAARIRRWLEGAAFEEAAGTAVFSCQPGDLWQAIPLPAPVVDQLQVRDRPFTRSLEILLSEYPCTLVILADEAAARLLVVYLGRPEEITRDEMVPVTGQGGAGGERFRSLIAQAEAAWRERGCERLVIGGSEPVVAALRDALPDDLRMRLVAELAVAAQAAPEEIASEIQEIEMDLEETLEEQHLSELFTGIENGGPAVLGLEQTLLAVRGKKVRLLIVEDDFHLEGGECPNCGFLGEGKEGICLLCGMALRPEPDIIEAAVKRAIDDGATVDVLRSRTWCRTLADKGRIGALVHPTDHPTVKDISTRRTITTGKGINQDVVHDEAIEESFPASDPPSF